jgi:hypothetical protein
VVLDLVGVLVPVDPGAGVEVEHGLESDVGVPDQVREGTYEDRADRLDSGDAVLVEQGGRVEVNEHGRARATERLQLGDRHRGQSADDLVEPIRGPRRPRGIVEGFVVDSFLGVGQQQLEEFGGSGQPPERHGTQFVVVVLPHQA